MEPRSRSAVALLIRKLSAENAETIIDLYEELASSGRFPSRRTAASAKPSTGMSDHVPVIDHFA